jgi:SAM-dependent methyltransferase
MTPDEFYDQLAPFYHLIYPDWEASMMQQAAALDSIIQEFWGAETTTILDAACGIGTQALGLAQLGYQVTAADLSRAALARARREAAARHLNLCCFVADMRHMAVHSHRQYDAVLACDNAVPHLLADEDILAAFQALHTCVRPGGGCLITVRDYDREDRTGIQVKPYGLRIEGSTRYVLFQVWEFRGALYELALYCIEDRGGRRAITHVLRTTYYAIGTERLMELMRQAGFRDVQRLDGRFFQPVLVGTKP